MKKTVTLKDVPDDLVDQVATDFESEGARVRRRKQAGGGWTVTAEWSSFEPAALKPAGLIARGARGIPSVEEEETDRPSRAALALSALAPSHYPLAKVNVGGEMKTRGKYRKGFPEGAIVHYTAGRDDPLGDVRSGLQNGYCYFVIAPNGEVYQNFPIDSWGYHAGVSAWPALGGGVSQYLVGIEICCAGIVRSLDGERFRPWYNEAEFLKKSSRQPDTAVDLALNQVRQVTKKRDNQKPGWYEKYTDLQEASLRTLLRWMKTTNPEVFDFNLVLGHDEVAPDRKSDPGGALSLSMPDFRKALLAEG